MKKERLNDTNHYIHESTGIVLIHDYKFLDHYSHSCSYFQLLSANRIMSYKETYTSNVQLKLVSALIL
jgi:hypothetical protein